MHKGIINTNDNLQPWKDDPTRIILPPEPNYLKDAENFRNRREEKRRKKEQKLKEKIAKEQEKKFGRSKIVNEITDVSFVMKNSTYKGEKLASVAKKDPQFIESFISNGGYTFSPKVLSKLKEIIKSNKRD